MRIRRRQLLVGAAAGALGASFLGMQAWQGSLVIPVGESWQTNVIAKIVRAHVPDAQVDHADMEAFTQEFLIHQGASDRLLAVRSFLTPMSSILPESLKRRLQRLDHQVLNAFLLGTNYFDPDRPSAKVTFIAYPDPYGVGCANPLAQFDFPQEGQA